MITMRYHAVYRNRPFLRDVIRIVWEVLAECTFDIIIAGKLYRRLLRYTDLLYLGPAIHSMSDYVMFCLQRSQSTMVAYIR